VTRIQLAEDVRTYLGVGQVAAVLSGQAGPPVYQCVTCRQPGDSRTEDTSAILWVGTDDPDDAVILSWAHARCAPSEIRPREELSAPGTAAAASAVPPRPDNTYASIADLRGGHTPTITIVPGTDTTAVLPDGSARSAQLDALRGYGFTALNLTSRDQPAGPAGWAVRVDRGHLVSIGSGTVRWWTSPNPPPMPEQWRAAARAQRHALIIIVTPDVYDDADQIDTADANAALRHAAATDRLVGGLLPVRGTLS
jgi:hypothetical protein